MNNRKILYTQSALWAFYSGLTSTYIAAFAIALGASNTVIGVLSALPWFANLLTQIIGAELVQHLSRKNIIVIFDAIRSLFWIPILAVPFLNAHPIPFVVIFYLFSNLFMQATSPAYRSLLADAVPQRMRGEFISARHRLINSFGLVAVVLGGLWLKQFPKESPVGFALMFGFGVLFGVASALVMRRLQEPRYQDHDNHHLKEFFTVKGPLRRFVIFSVFFCFAFMLASPLVTVYLLKHLELSYHYYGFIIGLVILTKVLTDHHIGKLTDTYGDRPFSIFGHIGTALVPLLFLLVTKQNLWLLIPIQIYSGIVWAAADITQLNMLLDLADPKKRALHMAGYNLYVSIALIVSPILGGWMSEHVVWILSGIPLVFVLSAILRFASALMLFGIREPRAKRQYSLRYVFRRIMHFQPDRGALHDHRPVKRR